MLACEHVTIIVNHLPSRGAASYYREEGGRQLKAVKDSLLREDPDQKLLIMGDMNDDPQDASMATCLGAKREISEVGEGDLYNPWWNVLASGEGTLSFRGPGICSTRLSSLRRCSIPKQGHWATTRARSSVVTILSVRMVLMLVPRYAPMVEASGSTAIVIICLQWYISK